MHVSSPFNAALTLPAVLSLLLPFGASVALPHLDAKMGLHALAVQAGKKYFGSAVDNGEMNDKAYISMLGDVGQFGQITPGNTLKWQFTEPTQGHYDFTGGDIIANFAKANRQILRCHNLIWYQQLPGFVHSTSWTKETLTALIKAHIAAEVGHYRGLCYAWDVLNEVVSDSGGYRDDVFGRVLGADVYIPLALRAAAANDPNAKLYYNDYGIEGLGTRKNADALALVRMVRAAGAPLHGVGLQGHFLVGDVPGQAALEGVLRGFVALGVEVAFTELDVRFVQMPPSPGGLQQQAKDYGSVVGACLAVERCVGWTVWGFSDKHSWVPSTFPGMGAATLFTADLQPKPAYDTVKRLLAAAKGRAKPPKRHQGVRRVGEAATTTTTTTTRREAQQPCREEQQRQWRRHQHGHGEREGPNAGVDC
ncbi:hypothetical protein P8C59_002696 [Phyllachora maydis]|uniref:Beta-xylanase n=1 Tax=Phyllachora maydis TaxID=1825666 RepID=A0AAD9I077_9PEZI|nr:hypothetical protein P8C59_002696 [Phyllachora maydis]